MWPCVWGFCAAARSSLGLSATAWQTPARALHTQRPGPYIHGLAARPPRGSIARRASSQSLSSPATAGMGLAAAEKLQASGLELELVPCLSDNYCPVLHHSASGTTILMDTPEARPIVDALRQKGWEPTHILNTHHHGDHVGGNVKLKKAFPNAQVIGPHKIEYSYPPGVPSEADVVPVADELVKDGHVVSCGPLTSQVLGVGGHTASHIAYFFPEVPLLLAGDCLFTLGCGRVFTGDFAMMQKSMDKLRDLPDDTVVFCAHEYTASNLDFALKVEPDNSALQERAEAIRSLRGSNAPTVPTLLQHEKATNPFLRWDAPAVQKAVGLPGGGSEVVFEAVRRWKDTGKKPTP